MNIAVILVLAAVAVVLRSSHETDRKAKVQVQEAGFAARRKT
jgi:hypothetical protein